ncbi:MAG TPA: hypothetical protein VF267_06930 [Gammaproteobacteria bacterium]
MNNVENKTFDSPSLRTRVVTLVVEQGPDGAARLVLEGAYMSATGFAPGDHVEAIVQPELISILHPE